MRKAGYVTNSIIQCVGGAQVAARAIGISAPAVYQWHGIVPEARIANFCHSFGVSQDAVRESNARMAQQKDAPRPAASSQKVSTGRKGFTQISTQELQALKTLASLYLKIHPDRTEVDSTPHDCGTSSEREPGNRKRSNTDFDPVHEKRVCGTKGE
jgi:hypothetical protein